MAKLSRLCMLSVLMALVVVSVSLVSFGSDESVAAVTNGNIMSGSTDVGDWTYDDSTHTLTMVAGSGLDTSTDSISMPTLASSAFNDITSIHIKDFAKDIIFNSGMTFAQAPKIYYEGTYGTALEKNEGDWKYYWGDFRSSTDYTPTKELTLTKRGGSESSVLTDETTSDYLFGKYFFKNETEVTIVLSGYTAGGSNLFYNYDVKTFTATHYTGSSSLLNAAKVRNVVFDALSTVNGAPIPSSDASKQLLVSVKLTNATSVGDNVFKNYKGLTTIDMPYVNTIRVSTFEGCTGLVDVNMPSLNSIGKSAFKGCIHLETVRFAENATLKEECFADCEALTTITSENIEYLEGRAFSGCESLYRSVLNDDKLVFTELRSITTSIYGGSESAENTPFAGCVSITDVELPAITNMGSYAFYNCGGLVRVVIGGTLTNVPAYAFGACENLATVSLSSNIATIENNAFSGCRALSGITLPDSVSEIGNSAFSNTGLTTFDSRNVTTIGNSVFSGCNLLEEVTLNSGNLSFIGDSVFSGCNKLACPITFPISLTYIGTSAFQSTKITSVTFTGTASAEIGENAFSGCVNLATLTMNDAVRVIGNYAFSGCTSLDGTLIFSTVLEIGEFAFSGCSNLDGITITGALTTIGTKAFFNCSSLRGTVSFPASLATIGESAFDATSNTDGYRVKITGISFAEGTSSLEIQNYAFRYCVYLAGTISFPTNLLSIGNGAFSNCSAITGLSFADGSTLILIGASAFNNCTSLSGTLSFPASLQKIDSSAFYGCRSIEGVQFVPTGDLTRIEGSVFLNCSSLAGSITFPDNLQAIGDNAFKATAISSVSFNDGLLTIGNNAFQDCKSLSVALIFPDSLTSIGNLAFSYSSSDANAPKLLSVSFGNNLQTIGNNAFRASLLSGRVTNGVIILPDSVTSLGEGAFSTCNGIVSVTFGNNLQTIGNNAFYNCVNMAGSITLPATLLTIGTGAFTGCTSLVGVSLGGCSNLTSIGNNAFYGCTGISSEIVIPSAVQTIGSYAFYRCSSVTAIIIESTVLTSIDQYAFESCSSAEGQLTLPATLATMGQRTFYGCSSLTGVVFGENNVLVTIPRNAFYGCTNLTGTVTIPSAVETIGDSAFNGTAVTKIIIGSSVMTLGQQALSSTQLAEIEVVGGNTYLVAVENILYNKAMTELIHCPAKLAGDVVIPDSVTSIRSYSFSNTSEIGSVTLPNSTLRIYYGAFLDSSISGSLVIPANAYEIDGRAFMNCRNLTELVVNSPAPELFKEGSIFSGCTGLLSMTVPVSVQLTVPNGSNPTKVFDVPSSIRNYVFTQGSTPLPTNFYSLNQTGMPWYFSQTSSAEISVAFVGVDAVPDSMFYRASSYNNIVSVDLGTATYVGTNAFNGCAKMKELIVSPNANNVKAGAFASCTNIEILTVPIDIDSTTWGISTAKLTSLTFVRGNSTEGYDYTEIQSASTPWANSPRFTVTISNDITYIGEYMKIHAAGSLVIPSSVDEIGQYAFYGAPIDSLVIDGVTTLNDRCFGNCSTLSSLVLPDSLTTVNGSPFGGCANLRNVTLPITLNYSGSMFSECFGLRSFTFTKGTNGIGRDYTESTSATTPWFAICGDNNFSVEFQDGVKQIGSYMFYHCVATGDYGPRGLNGTIEFPDTLTAIGTHAFDGCTLVETIDLSSSSVSLGYSAFKGCTGAKTLIFPLTANSVVSVDHPAFEGCTGFNTFHFTGNGRGYAYSEENYQYTPWYYSRNNTLAVDVGSGISGIGSYTFKDCTKLSGQLELGTSITYIGTHAFEGDTNLSVLKILASSVEIGESAFKNCSGIRELYIDVTVNAVGYPANYIFEGCTGLTALHLIGSGNGHDYSETAGDNYYQYTPWYLSNAGFTVDVAPEIVKIGNNMFRDNDSLGGNVTAPTLKIVGDNAFSGCTGLVQFSADTLNSAGVSAFSGCTRLTTFNAPVLPTVSERMFENCSAFTTATLTACTAVSAHAFENSGILYVNSAEYADFSALTSVGDYAFAQSKVVKIVLGNESAPLAFGDYVLFECPNLMEAHINGQISKLPYNTFRSAETNAFNSQLRVLRANRVTMFSANLENFRNLTEVHVTSVSTFEAEKTESEGKFRNCTRLATFELSDYTVILPKYMFQGCIALADIDTSHVQLDLGYEFYGCTALNDIVLTAANVSDYSFFGCTSLVSLSASTVTDIGNFAFSGSGLVNIGEAADADLTGARNIGTSAFAGCRNLVTVSLPNAVRVDASAFSGCTSLTAIALDRVASLSDSVFYGCTSLSNVTAPNATSVGVQAFYGCRNLVTLSLPDVETVGDITYAGSDRNDYETESVFNGCSSLTTVSMPRAESVGAFAFYNCTAFRSFNGDNVLNLNSVDYVGFAAFLGTAAESATVGSENSTVIGDYAFDGCTKLESFTVNGALASFGSHTLNGCLKISTLTIPITVSWLSAYQIPNLQTLNFTAGGSGQGIDYTDSNNNTVWRGSSNYTVTFAQGVVHIGDYMLLSASGTVSIPTSVRSIGDYAFYGAPMTALNIADGTETLGDKAFGDCTHLTTLALPNTLNDFEGAPFDGCTGLADVSLPITFAFTGNMFTGCSSLSVFNFTRGTDGTGHVYADETYKLTPWYNAASAVTATFAEGIVSIGDNMFRGCTKLEGTVALPASCTAVKDYAFEGDSNISELSFAANNVNLGKSAFKDCSGITSLTIPARVNTVGYADGMIFEGCTGLRNLTLTGTGDGAVYTDSGASDYKYTPWYLSRNNASLTVTVADGITSIGNNTFRGCTALSGTLTCAGVSTVGAYAFSDCTHLARFTAPLRTSMGEHAFENDTALTEFSAAELTSVPAYAFYGCTGLATATLSAAESIGAHAFEKTGIKTIVNGTGEGVCLTKVINVGNYAFAESAVEVFTLGTAGTNMTIGDYMLWKCPSLRQVSLNGRLGVIPLNTFISPGDPRILSGFSSPLVTLTANDTQTVGAVFTDCFRSLTDVHIAGATSLDPANTEAMFRNCVSLTTVELYSASGLSVELPRSAFYGCTSLNNINLDHVNLERGYEFYGCTSLASAELVSTAAVKIPEYAFYGCRNLASVTGPNVTTVDTYAFAGSGVMTIAEDDLPEVIQIGAYAFSGCLSLTSVEMPGVRTIGNYVFEGCSSLETIDMPILREISVGTFYNCTNLRNVSLRGAQTVNRLAFYGCRALTTLTMEAVTAIGDTSASSHSTTQDEIDEWSVFYSCVSLTTVNMPNIRDIGALAFYGCSNLTSFNAELGTDGLLLPNVNNIRYAAFYGTGFKNVTVGKTGGISEIGDYAFYANGRMQNFTSPSLTALPEHLFNNTDVSADSVSPAITTVDVPKVISFNASLHGCRYLTTVNAPSAQAFCDNAFYGCSNLTTVNLTTDSTLTVTLSERMFYMCERLSTINLDYAVFDGVVSGGEPAETFFGCRSLESVTLEKATAVVSSAFYGCTALTTVNAPKVKTIGEDAFNGCSTLATAEFPAATMIYARAFSGCNSFAGFNESAKHPFLYVEQILEEAFRGCAFTELTLGPNLRNLGARAFAYNPLATVIIPNSANTNFYLPEGVFQGCPLTEVHISSSVNSIRSNVFDFSSTTQRQVSFWFNVGITTSLLYENAIVGRSDLTINIHADADSIPMVDAMVTRGSISGDATIVKIQEYSANITIQSREAASPVFNTAYAVYGGKIVLPFNVISQGGTSTYSTVKFALLDGESHFLAVYASDADFAANTTAYSGLAVPIYPLDDKDGLVLSGKADDVGYIQEMKIETNSYNVDVDLEEQYTHYGGIVTIPKFSDPFMQVKELKMIRVDGVSYSIDTNTQEIRAGYYFSTVELLSEDITIEVSFISKGETQIAEVKIQSSFAVPTDLLYMQNPDPGYTFGGWWSNEGGKGNKATETTTFSSGDRWYAYFAPITYNVQLLSTDPSYNEIVQLSGPFMLYRVDGSLYYTDHGHTTKTLLFEGKSITGYYVDVYADKNNNGALIGEEYGPLTPVKSDTGIDRTIDLYMEMNRYTLHLEFTYQGEPITTEAFKIENWSVAETDTFHTGDSIYGVMYSDLENGLLMPVPLHDSYAFSRMVAGSTQVPYNNGGYYLSATNFGDSTEITIRYEMDLGIYTVRYSLHDNLDTVYSYSKSISLGETFPMPSVSRNYYKTGYIFSYLAVNGSEDHYAERQDVTLTQSMIDASTYCVIDVYAVWTTIPYDIEFILDPYTGTIPGLSEIRVDETVTIPAEVFGYTGHYISGWHWIKGTEVSEIFTGDQILTKEVVDAYADEGNIIRITAEWSLKTYTFAVNPDYGYRFSPDTIEGTYQGTITLWENTYTRSFMQFDGWRIGENVYANASTVTITDAIAAVGDENDNHIVVEMEWIKNRYQVQYNLDGGEGQIPSDDKLYIVNETPFTLASGDGFYRNGYTFIGWKYSKDAYVVYVNESGLFESVLTAYATNNIVTFYAVWEQKSYKISYSLDGGVGGTYSPTRVFYGDEITISQPTRGGYDFAGWTATGITSGALYRSTSGYRAWDGTRAVITESFMDLCDVDEGTVSMTAHWVQAEYTVSYSLNGGSGVIIGSQSQITIGQTILLPTLVDGERTGYVHIGWGVDPNNTIAAGTVFNDTIAETCTGNTLVIYAIWSPVEYTVKYRYSADYDYTTVNVAFGEIVNIPILDRSGYTFNGWKIVNFDPNYAYYSKDGQNWFKVGTTNVDGTYFRNLTSVNGDTVTIDAEWAQKQYRIVYNTNGGTGVAPKDSNVYVVGDSVTMADYNVLAGTNGGKTITGWSLEPNGSNVNVNEFTASLADRADVTGAVNFYGVWIDGMCTVIVDLGDCSPNAIPAGWVQTITGAYQKSVNYGVNTKDVMADWDGITLTKDGYNFIGWKYSNATVTSTVTVTPDFEKVDMNVMFAFGGIIAAFAVGAVVMVRLRV